MENLKDIPNNKSQNSVDVQITDIPEEARVIPNILVIEDEEVERFSLKSALESEGFFVEAVEKGMEAEGIAKTVAFDIAVVDNRLPDTDGVTLTKKLKEISPDIVPIFVTAYSSLEVALDAMRIGAYDYIAKPLDISKLIKIIYKILDERRNLSRSKKILNKIVEKNDIDFSDENNIVVVSSPDPDIINRTSAKVSVVKRIFGIFAAIKNYYLGGI